MSELPTIGEVIEYQSFGTRRIVRVTDVYEDVKNGEPGFDGIILREAGRTIPADSEFNLAWGYARQITRYDVEGF